MPHPQKFGPFRLNRLIGRGGMGAVYQATNETNGQIVAVKALLVPLEEERERFEAEISTLKLLRHENIVKLYGFGQEDGVLYYAMEFVPGPSLATLLKRGRRFTWEEVVYIGVSICKALKHAHDRGVVHRDVKPANILLLDDGVVKVSDYGIAQYFGNSRLTGANQVVGTIEYMAPEQAQAGPLTPRTDIYALGALLYALLTGAPPYVARSLPELLQRYRQGSPDSIRYARPEAPKVLDAFLKDLLQILPEKRPGDARLIGRRLEGILKSASSNPNANPFWRQRFTIDGRSTIDGVSNSRVDLENPSGVESVESVEVNEIAGERAPDFPYRDVFEEKVDNAPNPFEKTTAIGPAGDSDDDGLLPSNVAGNATKNEATNDDEFELGDFSLDGESKSEPSPPHVECDETVLFERNTSNATTTLLATSTVDDDSPRAKTPLPELAASNVAVKAADLSAARNDARQVPNPDANAFRTSVPDEKLNVDSDDIDVAETPSPSSQGPQPTSEFSVSQTSAGTKLSLTQQTKGFELAIDEGDFDVDFHNSKKAKTPSKSSVPTVANSAFSDTDDSEKSEVISALETSENTVCQTPDEYFNVRRNSEQFFDENDDDSEQLEATPLEKFKKSRFTPVDEKELGKLPIREDKHSPYFIALQFGTAFIVLSLIFVFFWAVFRTPSADAIFQRIEKKIESGANEEKPIAALRRAENDLTRFLDIYPNDVRAEQIRFYLSELDVDKFEQRIERRLQRNDRDYSALPVERAYLDAASANQNDLDEVIAKLTAFVDLFGAPSHDSQTQDGDETKTEADGGGLETSNKNNADKTLENKANNQKEIPVSLTDQLVVVAQRRLERLKKEREKTRRADLELLNDRLKAAVLIRETNPERAKKMQNALFKLYGDRSWAQDILKRAQNWNESAPKTETEKQEPTFKSETESSGVDDSPLT